MTPTPPARLTIAAGALCILTGCMHGFGLKWATGLAAQGPHDLGAVIPALWLGISAAMAVIGVMLVLIGLRPAPGGRALVALAALLPLANAGLLIAGAGIIAPVWIFGVVGLVTLAAAATHGARNG
jgi:hypothetical protein